MDSGDRPETGLPALLPAPLESRRRSGLLSRLSLAEGHRPDSRRVSLGISAAIVVFGLSVLVGWAAGLDLLTSWDTGGVQTKVNAALCFVFLGLALVVLAGSGSPRRIRLVRGLAFVAMALAGATLLEHMTGIDLGIDQALHADPTSASSPYPGRFAVQTAIAFIGAALGIFALGRRGRWFDVAQVLGVLCAGVGGISVLGYLYGAQVLLSIGSAAQVSLPASVSLIALGAALVTADPDHSLVRLASDPGPAGQVLRRFLPAAFLVVPLGAWLRLVGERAGLYDEAVGLSIMVAFEALLLVAVGTWTTAHAVRSEERRRQAFADLVHLGVSASTPLIETAPVGLAVLDRELRFLYVNPALAAIGGVSPLASLGQRIDRIVPALVGDHVDALNRVLESGVAIRDHEVTGPTGHSGRLSTLLISAGALRDAQGETHGLTISVVEITERKNREETLAAIAQLRRQAQVIGESIPFGIWVADPAGRMQYLSESFLQMAGQTTEQAQGNGWMGALAPETAEQTRRDWHWAVDTKTPWNHELIVLDTDGRRRTVLSRGFPVRDESGEVTSWAGLNLDITDRKDAEAFREAFTGILSHELRTPITSIFAASTLLSRPGLDDGKRTELLGDIGHEAERLIRLVEDLVVLARTERGTIRVRTVPVLLQRVLPRVCEQEQRRWPEITFEVKILEPLPVARADEDFVEQIVRNLLGNAAKYGPPNGPIELIADAPDGWPRVRVLDRGPGVDPVEADRLFEVFYRSGRTARVAGSGIGLFVAHRLVESIGGTIWAKPRDDGPGAEFGFRVQPLTAEPV
jgi:PAS domain S-box-containing protein